MEQLAKDLRTELYQLLYEQPIYPRNLNLDRVPMKHDKAVIGGSQAADKVIGRFPGETSCLSLCWAVLDLFIARARGVGLGAFEHLQLAQMRAATTTRTPNSLTA